MSLHHYLVLIIPRTAFSGRLDLLEDSGQVSAAARLLTLDFVDAAERVFAIQVNEDNGAMLVTHLAMALTRTERRLPPGAQAPAALAEEVRGEPVELDFIRERLDRYAAELGEALPEAEYVFVTAHVCTLTAAR